MIVRFDEEFQLSIEEMYGYFNTPKDWTRIFGFPGRARELGDGWYSVPLKRFPFPLRAKYTFRDPPNIARWIFRGFWHGEGEIQLTSITTGVRVEGFEKIAVRPLFFLSPLFEKLFLEKSFKRIWDIGWYRLRQKDGSLSGL